MNNVLKQLKFINNWFYKIVTVILDSMNNLSLINKVFITGISDLIPPPHLSSQRCQFHFLNYPTSRDRYLHRDLEPKNNQGAIKYLHY